jgi:hypothetical protein
MFSGTIAGTMRLQLGDDLKLWSGTIAGSMFSGVKLISARHPEPYCISIYLWLKTRRLGRFLKKTLSTQNNKLKVLSESESDVDSV